MEFQELTELCQALAIANKLSPTEDSIWRALCRSYSKKFSTPLIQVLSLDPEHVILEVYEDQMDEVDTDENLDKLLEIVYGLEDPEYEKHKKKEVDDFVKQAEEEERHRLASNKPIHPALRKNDSIQNSPPEMKQDPDPEFPIQGGIDLSYLEQEEQGSGFE